MLLYLFCHSYNYVSHYSPLFLEMVVGVSSALVAQQCHIWALLAHLVEYHVVLIVWLRLTYPRGSAFQRLTVLLFVHSCSTSPSQLQLWEQCRCNDLFIRNVNLLHFPAKLILKRRVPYTEVKLLGWGWFLYQLWPGDSFSIQELAFRWAWECSGVVFCIVPMKWVRENWLLLIKGSFNTVHVNKSVLTSV